MKYDGKYLKGYVRVSLVGRQAERFLNLCSYNNYNIWNLEYVNDNYECNMYVKDYRRLKQIAKKTHMKMIIKRKVGMPFYLHAYAKRKAYFAGLFVFAATLFFFSSIIWKIDVQGNSYFTSEAVTKYLASIDISPGILKHKINCKELQEQIRSQYPNIIWVSASVNGTKLEIHLKENLLISNSSSDSNSETVTEPVSIASDKKAKIITIVTRVGNPLVKEGDTVKKGDILVNGLLTYYNDDLVVTKTSPVKADADITGQYPIKYKDIFSLKQTKLVRTGKKRVIFQLQNHNKLLAIPILKPKYSYENTMTQVFDYKLAGYFPVSIKIEKTTFYELEKKIISYSQTQAKLQLENNLATYCDKLTKKGIQIDKKNVKIETNNNTVIASGTLTVTSKIGVYTNKTVEEGQLTDEFDGN